MHRQSSPIHLRPDIVLIRLIVCKISEWFWCGAMKSLKKRLAIRVLLSILAANHVAKFIAQISAQKLS